MKGLQRFMALLLFSIAGTTWASGIVLENADGSEGDIGQYLGAGRWVVLNIWAPNCPPCREEMPELVHFDDEHKDDDARVIGIAIGFPDYGEADKPAVRRFMEDYLIDFPVYFSDGSITRKLGAGRLEGLPTTLVYAPDGELVARQLGAVTQKLLEEYIEKNRKKYE